MDFLKGYSFFPVIVFALCFGCGGEEPRESASPAVQEEPSESADSGAQFEHPEHH